MLAIYLRGDTMNLLEELEINQELLSKTEVRLTMPIKPKHLQP